MNDVDQLLRNADPLRGGLRRDAPLDRVVRRIAHDAANEARTARRPSRRWHRRAIVVPAAAAIVVTAGFAYVASTHTGWFGDGSLSEQDGSEWLRTDAPDFADAVAALAPARLPLPGDISAHDAVEHVVSIYERAPGVVQTTAIRGDFAHYAWCAWEREWLRVDARADTAARAAAARLSEIPSWPVTKAVDGGNYTTHLRSVAAAARRGDAAVVARDWRANCAGTTS